MRKKGPGWGIPKEFKTIDELLQTLKKFLASSLRVNLQIDMSDKTLSEKINSSRAKAGSLIDDLEFIIERIQFKRSPNDGRFASRIVSRFLEKAF